MNEEGSLALPNTRKTRFPQETSNKVKQFYKSEGVSRVMPGENDCFKGWEMGSENILFSVT